MDNFINCYGSKNKKLLVENYDVNPILYLKLLPNQSKDGCCGRLTTNYYIFSAINKATNKEILFYAGKHCAEEILKLIQKPKLELFNPLSVDLYQNMGGRNSSITTKIKLDSTNNELIEAIKVISVAWSSTPPPSILKIIEYTLSNPMVINYKGIEWVNKSLTKDFKNRTLSEIVQDLKKENPRLRDFTFERLKRVISIKFPKEINKY
ncbi:hypothetical protein JSO56_01510 [Riemerella anatipestifer]|uniref:hypothetical protein n=1 Tax=Riemerella anatipestifer TaxID=34085 RepID=UPI0030C4DE1A